MDLGNNREISEAKLVILSTAIYGR